MLPGRGKGLWSPGSWSSPSLPCVFFRMGAIFLCAGLNGTVGVLAGTATAPPARARTARAVASLASCMLLPFRLSGGENKDRREEGRRERGDRRGVEMEDEGLLVL